MEKKVILDPNIWISIFLGKKNLTFLEFIFKNDLTLIADNNLRNELLDVISRKKFSAIFSAQDIVDAMDFFDSLSTFILTNPKFFGSPDLKDDFLFDLAFQSNTEIIVSGDKKLLEYKIEKVSVISLAKLWETLKT